MSDIDVLPINGFSESLISGLLSGKEIRYQDDRFPTASGKNSFLLQLIQNNNNVLIYYLQFPLAYPIPDELKKDITEGLKQIVKTGASTIEFVNAGTLAQKKDFPLRAMFSGGE